MAQFEGEAPPDRGHCRGPSVSTRRHPPSLVTQSIAAVGPPEDKAAGPTARRASPRLAGTTPSAARHEHCPPSSAMSNDPTGGKGVSDGSLTHRSSRRLDCP